MPSLIPDVQLIVDDGGLGVLPPNTDSVQAKIGVSSLGTPNQVYLIQTLDALVATLGQGPLVDAAAQALALGGGPILCVPVDTSAYPGLVGPVQSMSTAPGTVSVSGVPRDGYQLVVQIVAEGNPAQGVSGGLLTDSPGSLAFKYSLDGGATWSDVYALGPGNTFRYTIPGSGLTVAFDDNSASSNAFVFGDEYTFLCEAPAFSSAALQTALDALFASTIEWSFVHIVGAPPPSLSSSTIHATTSGGSPGTSPDITVTGRPTDYSKILVKVSTAGVRSGSAKAITTVTPQNSAPPIVVSGTPTVDSDWLVRVSTTPTGSPLVGQFQYSQDGGTTWSTAANFTVGGAAVPLTSGVSAQFPTPTSGSYLDATGGAGTQSKWSFHTYTTAKVQASINGGPFNNPMNLPSNGQVPAPDGPILNFPDNVYSLNDQYTIDFIASAVTGTGAILTAVDAKMSAYENADKRYAFALLEAPNLPDINVKDIVAALPTSKRVSIAAGYCTMTSVLTQRSELRSAAWPIAARISAVPLHEDLGRVKSGPITNVTAISRDERTATVSLDSLGFSTLRTIVGKGGFYITAGRMLVDPSSDFQFVQHRRVMDSACRITRQQLVDELNDSVTVNSTTGTITEIAAAGIETPLNSALNTVIVAPGHASSVKATVNRTDNILSTNKLNVKVRLVPLGYVRAIEAHVGYENPALSAG